MTAALLDVLEPDGPAPVIPPSLPTDVEVQRDPARSAVAASVAVLIAGQLGLEDVADDAVAVLRRCVERLASGP